MASVRTEFALLRTGFTIASFGSAVTQLLGRDSWAPWVTDGLTIAFLLLGMIVIQSALSRFRATSLRYGAAMEEPFFSRAARTVVPWGLQVALATMMILVIVH